MEHKEVFKTLGEAQAFVQPWIDKVSADLGCGIEPYSHGDWFYGAYLNYLGYGLGSVMMKYKWDPNESWKYYPYVLLSLNTKITFTMKSTFTKSNMRHDVKINLNASREMTTSDKDYKKFIDWAKLIMAQLKTAEAKKRKFQADVDFE